MWVLVTVRLQTSDPNEQTAIRRELNQYLLNRPWVSFFDNSVAVDAMGPADIDQVGNVLANIAANHPDRFLYVAVFQPSNVFPRFRPQANFNEALFEEIVGPRMLATPMTAPAAFRADEAAPQTPQTRKRTKKGKRRGGARNA